MAVGQHEKQSGQPGRSAGCVWEIRRHIEDLAMSAIPERHPGDRILAFCCVSTRRSALANALREDIFRSGDGKGAIAVTLTAARFGYAEKNLILQTWNILCRFRKSLDHA